jgi:uncharacterized protein
MASSITQILKTSKKITVVGISANPERPSHWIAKYLSDQGYEVVGVNPGKPKIEGIKVVASLAEVAGPLEIVNVFRSSDAIEELIEHLRPFHPPVVWLQPGAQNPAAEEKARAYGMQVISGPCIYQEHRALA